MKKLITSSGEEAIVDEDIYEKYKNIKFSIRKGYASYTEYDPRTKINHTYKLHRLVVGAKPGQEIDHINRNKLDNRRINLRLCTRSENNLNRGAYGLVKHVGISIRGEKFNASATVNGKTKHIGNFSSVQEAIVARREYINALA